MAAVGGNRALALLVSSPKRIPLDGYVRGGSFAVSRGVESCKGPLWILLGPLAKLSKKPVTNFEQSELPFGSRASWRSPWGRNTPRVTHSSAAGAGKAFHNSIPPSRRRRVTIASHRGGPHDTRHAPRTYTERIPPKRNTGIEFINTNILRSWGYRGRGGGKE